jgi:hypothetical protein
MPRKALAAVRAALRFAPEAIDWMRAGPTVPRMAIDCRLDASRARDDFQFEIIVRCAPCAG